MKRPKPQQTLGLRLVAEKGLDAYARESKNNVKKGLGWMEDARQRLEIVLF